LPERSSSAYSSSHLACCVSRMASNPSFKRTCLQRSA
jgi:hypothetical protein